MRSGRPSRLVVLAVVAVVALALGHRDEIRGRAERRARPRHAGSRGRAGARLRPRRGRPHRRRDGRRLPPRRPQPPARRLGSERGAARPAGDAAAGRARACRCGRASSGSSARSRSTCRWPAAGPSIVRAGVMGALGVLATLAGRRASRLYALAVAAVVTLAIDPRDRRRRRLAAQLRRRARHPRPRRAAAARDRRAGSARRGWRGALAEGAAVTIAATLATAPLIAFHFEALSTTTLVANLLALPAVAPAMWLGMLAAVGGQVPGFPVAILNAVDAPLLAYIAQVAAWCGRPSWAYLHVRAGAGRPRRLLRRPGRGRHRRPGAPAPPPPRRASGAADVPPTGLKAEPECAFGPSAADSAGASLWSPGSRLVLAWSGGGAGASGPASGLRVDRPRRRPGRRDPAAAGRTRRRSSSTAGRPATISRRSCAPPASTRLGVGDRHPRTVRPRGWDRGAARALPGRPARSTHGSAVGSAREAEAAGAAPVRIAAGDALRCRPAAARGPLAAAASCSPIRSPAPTRMRRPSSSSSAGAGSRCCSPPTPRRRQCRSTRGRSTCSRSPTTAARTPASTPCSIALDPRLAVISVGADNPYGHPTPAHAGRRSPRTACRPCAPTDDGTDRARCGSGLSSWSGRAAEARPQRIIDPILGFPGWRSRARGIEGRWS